MMKRIALLIVLSSYLVTIHFSMSVFDTNQSLGSMPYKDLFFLAFIMLGAMVGMYRTVSDLIS